MKIGMIGGIGPESTVDYYKRIINLYRQQINTEAYPEVMINSINMTAMLALQAAGDWNGLTGMLCGAVEALYEAGAHFAFIASNTPHIVFNRVEERSPIPLVSIVEATRRAAETLNLKKVGLLGTLFTMQGDFYQAAFAEKGIEVVVPNHEEEQYIHQKLFSEIELGVFLDETKAGLLDIVKRLIDDEEIGGVILGCTELPLILTQSEEYGIPFLNTTKLHVDRIIEKYLELGKT